MNQPLVSIIIPTYNRADLILETLQSVQKQTYTNWECIIVDDGSTDNTQQVVSNFIKEDTRFQYHIRPEHHKPGGNGARNYGFTLAKGEYINWFDDDDIMLNNFLDIKIKNISSNLDLIITNGIYVDNNLQIIRKIPLEFKNNIFKEYIYWKELQILTPSVFFKKKFIEKFDLFNVNIIRGQETEFFSRVFFEIEKNKYLIIDEATYLYRQHVNTKSSLVKTYNAQIVRTLIDILIENLNRAIKLQDKDLINYLYNSVIKYYFTILDNKDKKSAEYCIKKIFTISNLNNFKTKKFILLSLSYIFNKYPYRFRKYLLNIY